VGIPAPGQPAVPAAAVLERIIGKNDLMSISYLEIGLRVARTVGRVHIQNADGSLAGYGTGFMVSPRLLLTNNHVFENASIAGAVASSSISRKVRTESFYPQTSSISIPPHLRHGQGARFQHRRAAQQPKYGWNGLSAAEGKLIVGEYVTIIQHPKASESRSPCAKPGRGYARRFCALSDRHRTRLLRVASVQ